MDGPRITLILLPILSDPLTGMNRGGISGIRDILITGKTFSDSIPIGADTKLVSVMTRIFITGTIAARVQVGIKDSMASVLPESLVMAYKPQDPLVVAFLLLKPLMGMLATASVPLGPLVLGSAPQEPLVLAFMRPGPLGLTSVNPEKLILARKDRNSSSPPGASSQIAQPGRSGIILQAKSRFPYLTPNRMVNFSPQGQG